MKINDSQVIDIFEKEVANYAGAKYGVAVSSGTNGIFLSLMALKHKGMLDNIKYITIPNRTYMSVPMSILNAGFKVRFDKRRWSGAYQLMGTNIWDSAVRFTKDMHIKNSLYVLSFQYRKSLPIGRGGMVLTDSKEYADLLKQLRFNGRNLGTSQAKDEYTIQGWNMYMLPEQAARGLTLMSILPEENDDVMTYRNYPDISKQEIFK